MGESQIPSDVQKVVEDRDKVYGRAWLISSLMIQQAKANEWTPPEKSVESTLYYYPWLMILGKLARAFVNPFGRDHWVDIIGYAKLVLDDLDKKEELQ